MVNPKPITWQKQLTMFFYAKHKPDVSQLHLGERAVISEKSVLSSESKVYIYSCSKKNSFLEGERS